MSRAASGKGKHKKVNRQDSQKKAKPRVAHKPESGKIRQVSDDVKKMLEEIKHTVTNRKHVRRRIPKKTKTFEPYNAVKEQNPVMRVLPPHTGDKLLSQPSKSKNNTHSPLPDDKTSLQKKEMETFKLNTCSMDTYIVSSDGVPAEVYIYSPPTEYVPIYRLIYPQIPTATHSILNSIREELITLINLSTKEFVDPTAIIPVKQKFSTKAHELMKKYLPGTSENDENILVGYLIHEMLGLGIIELLLADNQLEEIVINNSKDPIWVYHKRHGWLKTTVILENEELIYNYSSSIGRRVGRQITNLYPLMDAHLYTGDRVNATLFPISTVGNTITIRKFARSPWTIIHLLEPKVKTISTEAVALIWLAIQYELNILVVGGTASGKTSFLNTLMPFIPPNQRIISIEDTREINLPKFLQWIPFSSREPNPEGKGGVSMLDLLMNCLRMRPDRIIIGEIRREKEVEVMFEAIRTGHSAYATFHADNAHQAYQRLMNPPISLPEAMLNALHMVVVQYRHRRLGIRRTLEVGEIVPVSATENKLNIVYRWNPKSDVLEKANKTFRIFNEINMYTGMNDAEIETNLKDKECILKWMVSHGIKTVNSVGKVFAEYYKNDKAVISAARSDANPEGILGAELMDEVRQAVEKK
ncbi:MAG: type II/IV secretion system ATPase subunit [Nanoarchaeota archaeon]